MSDILLDGSMKGRSFSGPDYKGEFPKLRRNETYSDFYKRVNECVKKGFHKGDLSWEEWHAYCLGSPHNDENLQNELVDL